MDIKHDVIFKEYPVGALVCRFQVNELHTGHRELIDYVCKNHKKVILLLGVAKIQNTKRNPLDFATRKSMIQKDYPNIIILPLNDIRSNEVWSRKLDEIISIPFGDTKSLLYGSRDSFIPYYSGKNKTIELLPSVEYNGTDIRDEISKEILESSDFRAGIIHANYAQRPVTYPTVDICVFNQEGKFLLGKKPNEKFWRFVGGFVDRDDENYEMSAKREFREETGGSCEITNVRYILSKKVNDWRYAKEESGIMTTLFLAEYAFGMAKPSDDIAELEWIDINRFSNYDGVRTMIIPEHREMMLKLIDLVYSENTIPNIGDRLEERENVNYTIE